MFMSVVLCGLDQHAWPPDHLVERGASWHHWVDGVFLLDTEINQGWAAMLACLLHRGNHIVTMTDRSGPDPIGLGDLREVGIYQRCGGIVAFVEELLPLADHAEIPVVDDGDVDFDPLLDDGRQLGHRHLETAVTDDDPDLRLGP